MSQNLSDPSYESFLRDLKSRIQTAQVRAALAVNRELVLLYWQIGQDVLLRQEQQGWCAKVITRLAKDLSQAFPDIKGFSLRNLKYMRSFAEAYPDQQFVQQLAAQIPWFHNCILLEKVKDPTERQWYVRQTISHGWSRNILSMQIDTGLYRRQGGAITNFERTLPNPQSDLAQQLVKDPYNFDFLSLGENALERDLKNALVNHIREFLLELGVGFAFIDSQYRLEVEGESFFVDLLFYHLKLRCYVVIDLKMTAFQPEFSGKMNFYISAVDDLLRHPDDQPTIGLILCRTKKRTIAEYALRDVNKPIGVSTYMLQDELPRSLRESLPSIEQLQMELDTVVAQVESAVSSESEQLSLLDEDSFSSEE